MTDILYVVGHGADAIDNAPLRWSLRSLAKHATNVGRIIVAGNIPSWLSDAVVKVPIDQTQFGEGKHWRMLRTEIVAIRELGLESPLLYSSDDHYLCKDTNIDEWPRYYCQRDFLSLRAFIEKHNRLPSNGYELAICKTQRALANSGLPHARYYSVHLDTWIEPSLVDEVEAFADRYKNVSVYGLEHQSIWGAFYDKHNPEAAWTEYRHKDEKKVTGVKDIEDKIKAGLPAFSSAPSVESNFEFAAWMDAYYNEPSPWEKVADNILPANVEDM